MYLIVLINRLGKNNKISGIEMFKLYWPINSKVELDLMYGKTQSDIQSIKKICQWRIVLLIVIAPLLLFVFVTIVGIALIEAMK